MSKFKLKSRGEIEFSSQAEAKAVYCGDHTALCRVLASYLMYVDTVDRSVSPRLMLDGFWEPWTTSALTQLVKPGMVCVNIGANVGYFTLLLADLVGPKGQVIAFEPNPRAFELLRANLEINGMTHAKAKKLAVSDGPGRAQLCAAPTCIGGGYIGGVADFTSDGAKLHEPDQDVVDVSCDSLDALLNRGQRVDLVLIDAEGSEEKIWAGMERVRADNPGLVTVMEVEYRRYKDPMGFLSDLARACGPKGLMLIDAEGDTVKAVLTDLAEGRTGVPDASDAMLVIRP
jgi:FkbM family methyltransferase